MAAKLLTCLVSSSSSGISTRIKYRQQNTNTNNSTLNLYHSCFSTCCKMRHRNIRLQHKRQVKKVTPELLPSIANFQPSEDVNPEIENSSVDGTPSMNFDPTSGNTVDSAVDSDGAIEKEADSQTLQNKITDLSTGPDNGEERTGIKLQDLIGMIRNAEKNIILLNQARVRTLEEVDNILNEKQALQAEINSLELRLAETDARMKAAAQEKIRVELLESQLEKLQHEFSTRGVTSESAEDGYEEASLLTKDCVHSLIEDLSLVKKENESLKEDLLLLKEELAQVRDTDERVQFLEKERLRLESALKELELKINISRDDVSELSTLKFDYSNLTEKVENLQALLDKATKQADHAIVVLQQNKDLRSTVERLEESLEEANVYKSSSEKLQRYNELMQQKIKLLEEHLQRSDEEINSYVQLYHETVKDFQDTLNGLKEESKRRSVNEPVEDMPWEFWSRLLLMIDGWFLEKKISKKDAQLLRDMTWKRNGIIRDAYMACKDQNELEAVATFLKLTSSPKSTGLHVIHIAAEMAPVAKVGGLGDVVTGLGKALQKRGHLVEIILPKYDCMHYDRIRDLRVLDVAIESYFDGRLFKNKVWVGTVEGLPVYLIEPQHPSNFFWRGQIYGENDDFKRFSYFSRAALEFVLQAGKKPDIIHCHDWQTAFVAPLYWDLYAPKGLDSARICFTCHNFEYQGTAPASDLASCGLDVNQLNRSDRMQDNSSHSRINPVKGAIVYSNIVTTVSPTYGDEVRTAQGGHGLHGTLNSFAKKFVGILNGIDTDAWNPATDTFIKVQYSSNDIQGKAENKYALRRQLGLSQADPGQPLVACITRLVPQKGVHLIRHAIYRTVELGGQFVLLGSSPVPHIQQEFEDIARKFESDEHVRLVLKYDEALSHLIYAASDMLIIPSIFEPCGLTQMIAMRFGSIPIVRKTGGLNDSVFDVHDDAIQMHLRNGFTFFTPDEEGLNSALDRAFNYYNKDDQTWQQLVQRVMNINYSWDSSASQYEDLYEKSVSRARELANRV